MVKRKSKNLLSLLLSLIRRTLLRSPMQFLAVVLITGIATTLFVGLTSNSLSLANRVDILYRGSNVADIWTSVTTYDKKDLKHINDIIGKDGVTEERFSITSTLNSYAATAFINEEIPTINAPYKSDNTEEENFFIIDRRLLETEKAKTGATIWHDNNGEYATVPVDFSFTNYRNIISNSVLYTTSTGERKTMMDLFNTCLKDGATNIFDDSYLHGNFKITGTMLNAETVQSSLLNSTSFIMSRNLFVETFTLQYEENFQTPEAVDSSDTNYEWISLIRDLDMVNLAKNMLFNQFRVNQYVSKVGKGISVDKARQRINEYFASKDNSNLLLCVDKNNLTSNVTIQSDIKQADQLAYIFPMIFFVVAILVVLTTLSQLILKDRTQIGTMKALGISKGRIIGHYIGLDMAIVLIGIILGIIIGPLVLPLVMNQKYAILYTLPQMSYTLAVPQALLLTLIALLISAFVTFLIVIGEVKLCPSESMRPKKIKSFKSYSKAKTRVKRPISVSIKMAFRNIRVNLVKSLMVVVGVMGCTGLLVCGYGVDDTLDYGINKDITNFYSCDVFASYASTSSMKSEIEAIEGVESVDEFSMLPVNIYSDSHSISSTIMVIDENSKNFYGDGKYFPNGMIGISSKRARELDVKKGDIVTFIFLGETYYGEIGFIMDVFYQHGIYVSVNDYPDLADYKNAAWIDVKDNYSSEEVSENIAQIDGISASRTKSDTKRIIESYMSAISLMTLTVKVFAILLAVVVLYNLALLNFKEKIRDIATLKVLGFSRLEIAYSLIMEIMMLTIVGIAFGLLIGKPLEIIVLFVNQTPVVDYLYTVFKSTYFISFVISFFTAFVVNIFLTYKIKTVKMVESLKSIE